MAKELSSEFDPEGKSRLLLVEEAWWSVVKRVGVAAHLHIICMVPDSHDLHLPSLQARQGCWPDTR